MVVAITVISAGFCGRQHRDAKCSLCALRISCQAAEKAMALWVPTPHRA